MRERERKGRVRCMPERVHQLGEQELQKNRPQPVCQEQRWVSQIAQVCERERKGRVRFMPERVQELGEQELQKKIINYWFNTIIYFLVFKLKISFFFNVIDTYYLSLFIIICYHYLSLFIIIYYYLLFIIYYYLLYLTNYSSTTTTGH